MSGVEPVVLASLIAAGGAVATTGITLATQGGGSDAESLAPTPGSDELTADSDTLARRRVQLQRRRGSDSLSVDPATGGATAINATGLTI